MSGTGTAVVRPTLFVRNNTSNTITFNSGRVRWELPPKPHPDFESSVPWKAAISPAFERLWNEQKITVALDEDFNHIIASLPINDSIFTPYTHFQMSPQASTTIVHNLDRNGPVTAAMFSLDGNTEYYNFKTEMLDRNTCRITTDDPLTFQITIF